MTRRPLAQSAPLDRRLRLIVLSGQPSSVIVTVTGLAAFGFILASGPPDSRYLNLRQLVGSLNIALRGGFLEPENCQRLIGFASLSRQVMQTQTALR